MNIISGKGGTGKTLLTAVLAEMIADQRASVLVVDLDVFVRGLTALLYFKKNETIKITQNNECPVSDFFKYKGKIIKNISICKYSSFDVVPSVSKVNDILNFNDIMPNSVDEAKEILEIMLKYIPEQYEYIFFDSRAGFDELIAATHQVSDFSLCVDEDDDISKITSDNLIEQLKKDGINKPIFRIRNKTRNMKKEYSFSGIDFIGSIPFDMDVLNSFGTKNFWNIIKKSLYREYLIKAWNTLAKKMELDSYLVEERVKPLGMQTIENCVSGLSSFNRIFFMLGIIIIVLSTYPLFLESDLFKTILHDSKLLISLSTCGLGIFMIIFVTFFNNRK